mgnify:CR=1 FL=1
MIAFTHIPKTAGTTLNYIFQKNFGGNLISVIHRKGSNYTYSALKNDSILYKHANCISGHSLKPFIDYKEYNSKLEWITFLRDPIKRFVSQYIHQQTGNLSNYKMGVEEWAAKYARSNWQVKWIAGEEDLEAAKQIINERFKFIGITEKFDESLEILSSVFNLDVSYSKPKMVVRDNELKNSLLLDKKHSLFEEQNELDIKLYNYVLEKYYPNQLELLNKKREPFFLSKGEETINLLMYKAKRNLIYRPFAHFTK